MTNGLKNLQSASRSASRRERLESGQSGIHGYDDDDSGISGIGLTPIDDLDLSYSSPAASSHSSGSHHGGSTTSSSGSSLGQHHQHHHANSYGIAMHQSHMPMGPYGAPTHHAYAGAATAGGMSSSYSSTHSSNPAITYSTHDGGASYMPSNGSRQQRLSSVDMGIESIINRPGHHRVHHGGGM